MKIFLVLGFSLVLSMSAFADAGSKEGNGPSICSYAKYTCASADDQVRICIFADNLALVVLELAGGRTFSQKFDAQGVALIGSIATYEYTDLTMRITHGFESSDGKLPGYLTYSSAGLANFPMGCTE